MASGGFIYITVSGADTVRRRLVTWGQQVTDLTPAWQQIADDLLGDWMWNITGEGGMYGAWAPLRPATVADRIRQGYGGDHPIMWRTGLLLRSLSAQGQPGNIVMTTPNSLTVGSTVPYAGYQQSGTSRMVARPLIGINRKEQANIINRLNVFIQDQVRQAGLDG
jgi:phage gpG-like protein